MEGKTKFAESVGNEIADTRLNISDRPQYKDGFIILVGMMRV